MIKVGTTAYKKLNAQGKITFVDYTYNDVEFDDEEWADAEKFLPADFDLVIIQVQGKEPICGWSTGSNWDGLFYQPGDKIFRWKRKPDERNLM